MNKLIVTHHTKTAQYFTEDLGDDIGLDMVQIPAGSFLMGSPEDELERYDDENPQHKVSVAAFFMGKYPVTQAQWKAVAALPQVDRKLDPNPSDFKGENRPVERISWYDAMEFCARLSQQTGREYRLPSDVMFDTGCKFLVETFSTDFASWLLGEPIA